MNSKKKKNPEKGDYVICTVTKLYPNSASVTLDEFKDLEGIIPVSEVANNWVKDIRKFIKMDQRIVLKVMPSHKRYEGRMLTLSLKRVKPMQQKLKMNEWKNNKKAMNYFMIIAKNLSQDNISEERKDEIKDYFENLYNVFEIAAKEDGQSILEDFGFDKDWISEIIKIAKTNIKEKIIEKRKILNIKTFNMGGIDAIKKTLDINKNNVEIRYISAPKYEVLTTGKDYKEAETLLTDTIAEIEKNAKKNNIEMTIVA
ncbi:MAG: hypothetical protein K0B02_04730 [DPANN group archaeon]|nr:hypothetical protein [DPANN group archaeon]